MRCRLADFGMALAEDAVGYAKFYSRSHAMIVRVFDESGGLIKTHESQSAFREVAVFGIPDPKWGEIVKACRCSQAGENTHRGRANRVLPTIARQFQSSAQHRVLRNRASEKRLRQNPKEVAS